MNAKGLLEYFFQMSPWVDSNDTVDKVIIGDPEKPLSKILVVWQSSVKSIEHAIKGGYDALITHEPTFYAHSNELDYIDSLPEGSATKKAAIKKKCMIEEAGLVVIRLHDVWDRFPEYGIPSAWAKQLGIYSCPSIGARGDTQFMYTIPKTTVHDFAKRIADSTKAKTCEVQIYGDPKKEVTKVGIGTGCYCEIDYFAGLGCDLFVLCDDGALFWSDISRANDMDIPAIRVFHATTEENGFKMLSEYMRQQFKDIQTDHFQFDTGVSFL